MYHLVRKQVRQLVFYALRKVMTHDEGRSILAELIPAGARHLRARRLLDWSESQAHPYPDIGDRSVCEQRRGAGTVFLSGRFRSGTTLLWNIFRHIPGCKAYYEPFNERRWFDPSTRGMRVDPSHRGVSDYWQEYAHLESLCNLYEEDWIRRDLLMDEQHWAPGMLRFLNELIGSTDGRAVLKFNRLDFRLPWARRHFPHAKVVHIYRHPRDQWCSNSLFTPPFPVDGRIEDFHAHDEFYLLMWARDLKLYFPFLDEQEVEHPYQWFYYLWKLSYLFGRKYAHVSIRFEDLIADPRRELTRLLQIVDMTPENFDELCGLCQRPRIGKWRDYAGDSWFAAHESRCEETLTEYLGCNDQSASDVPLGMSSTSALCRGASLSVTES